MNASLACCPQITVTTPITAMLILTAPTPRDRSTVPVIRDTQEMESRV